MFNSALPYPDILRKLNEFRPDAADIIFVHAEIKQKIRHDDEFKRKRSFLSKAFWGGFFNPFTSQRQSKTITPQLSTVWKTVGDDLRSAIISYMKFHKITPSDIRLTNQEIKNLGWDKNKTEKPFLKMA